MATDGPSTAVGERSQPCSRSPRSRSTSPAPPALTPALGRYEANGRPAVLHYELEPEDECDDGLWCALTVNLPEHPLPGDDWAFVPVDNLRYLRELERQGLAEVGTAVRYGNFGQVAVMARLAPALIAEEG